MGDFPSEMSVTFESAPGEATGLREKKDVNLFRGEAGFWTSRALSELNVSIRKGGGLPPEPVPILLSIVL